MSLCIASQELWHRCMRESKCKVAIDAGANVGGYTQEMLDHGFVVHCFEPVPSVFATLNQRLSDNPNVFLNCSALSDTCEVIKNVTVLSCWTLAPHGTAGLDTALDFVGKPGFDINAVTLDSYLGHPAKRIGLFKLDVDGYEFKAIKGAEQTIRRCQPAILCEFNCYINKLGQSPQEFVEFILSLGYTIWNCDGSQKFTSWEQVEPEWPWHSSFDVILLPKQ